MKPMKLVGPVFHAVRGIGGFACGEQFAPFQHDYGAWLLREDMEAHLDKLQGDIQERRLLGQLVTDGVDMGRVDGRIRLDRVSHLVTKMWIDIDVMVEVEVLRNALGSVVEREIGAWEFHPRLMHSDIDSVSKQIIATDFLTVDIVRREWWKA